MHQFIGLDVSMKETYLSVREGGKRIWRGKCASDPMIIASLIRKRAPNVQRLVFETGPLSVWFFHALIAEGLPAICIDARHAKAALDMAPNKTDQNDADGLAHICEVGFYREVRVKGYDSMLMRTLHAVRKKMLKMTTQMSNQLRGVMKTFGLIVPKGGGHVFENHVRNLAPSVEGLEQIILPLLDAWKMLRSRIAQLTKQLVVSVRRNEQCQLLMAVPGVGSVTASSFVAAVEDPGNFRKSRSVGAWLGLTTKRYQSGEVDFDGHISRRGDAHLRGLLYEAAVAILTRSKAENALRSWGLNLIEKVGFKRATVAVARKLAVIMHSMLRSGERFNPSLPAAAGA